MEALTVGLKREGFRVQIAQDGAEALELFDVVKPDLVLLDVMLPKISGVDVCRELRRRSTVPIIMVTAKGSEIDTVVGLEVGADDYVTKPYRLRELVARMRAVLRRRPADASSRSGAGDVLEVGDVRLDPERHEVDDPGRAGQAAAEGVRAARAAARSTPVGCCPRHAHRPGVGHRLRRRHQDARRARQAPAGQGRGRSRRTRPASSRSAASATSTRRRAAAERSPFCASADRRSPRSCGVPGPYHDPRPGRRRSTPAGAHCSCQAAAAEGASAFVVSPFTRLARTHAVGGRGRHAHRPGAGQLAVLRHRPQRGPRQGGALPGPDDGAVRGGGAAHRPGARPDARAAGGSWSSAPTRCCARSSAC